MIYELLGFGAWFLVYSVLKTVTENYVSVDYWFFVGCIAGVLCAAIAKIVKKIKEEA